jgi:pyridoxine 5-phosphate synthase
MGSMLRLGVNVDHIATLRQQRRGSLPDPVDAALVCERSGASGIVCHLREDRRHIQDEDVRRLRQAVATQLNLEMSIAADIVQVALAVKPDQVTLVPEKRQELTTEGGLDVISLTERLKRIIPRFQERGIDVSLFIDPDARQIEASREVGASIIELHTGRYAAKTEEERSRELQSLVEASKQAKQTGLIVAAGHGLEYDNAGAIAKIPEIEELNIGYSIVVRALEVGLARAVEEMVSILKKESAHAEPTANIQT